MLVRSNSLYLKYSSNPPDDLFSFVSLDNQNPSPVMVEAFVWATGIQTVSHRVAGIELQV